jgi:hypothetical protein
VNCVRPFSEHLAPCYHVRALSPEPCRKATSNDQLLKRRFKRQICLLAKQKTPHLSALLFWSAQPNSSLSCCCWPGTNRLSSPAFLVEIKRVPRSSLARTSYAAGRPMNNGFTVFFRRANLLFQRFAPLEWPDEKSGCLLAHYLAV